MTDKLISTHGGLQAATPITVDSSTGDMDTPGVIQADGLQLVPQSAAPASPIEGEFYIDVSDNLLRQYLNGSWQVVGGAGGLTSYAVSSNTTANPNEEILVDTSAGIVTITLPATAVTGNRVRLLDAKGTWGTYKCVAARNGNKIHGAAADLDLTIPGDSVELVYYAPGTDWRMA